MIRLPKIDARTSISKRFDGENANVQINRYEIANLEVLGYAMGNVVRMVQGDDMPPSTAYLEPSRTSERDRGETNIVDEAVRGRHAGH